MTIPKVLSLATLAAVLAVTAAAQDADPANPGGRPKYKNGQPARYVVWHDADGWHLRTTTNKDTKFDGAVEIVGGKFVNLQPATVEGKAGAKKKANPKSADYGTWNPEHTVFQFNFSTRDEGSDGFDMKVSDTATAIKFVLKVNGKEVPEAIFIGSKNEHPKGSSFSLPAFPK